MRYKLNKLITVFFVALLPVLAANPASAQDAMQYRSDSQIGGYFSTGLYEGGEDAFGLGFSLGGLVENGSTLYTVRGTFFVDFFDSLTSSDCRRKEINSYPVLACENSDDDVGMISEYALLYGKNWKSLWFSGGAGYIKGENVGNLLDADGENFSAVGFAYSILWNKDLKGYGLELSGNLNSDNNFAMLSGRLSFMK